LLDAVDWGGGAAGVGVGAEFGGSLAIVTSSFADRFGGAIER